ncbi:alpha/beta fold hydrolase [Paraburkholderia terrae]
MFAGFLEQFVTVSGACLRVRTGGKGPPVLLLHGHPRTHATWSRVAPILAEHFFVVCPDLRGFGKSSKPADMPEHAGSSKRAKAMDCIELMRHLGHERFSVAGHDRGSYVALRAALDHPAAITRLAVLDSIPIIEHLLRCDERFARRWYHWFFFAQPEKPERAILVDPLAWYGGSPDVMGVEEFEDFRQAVTDPSTVHGMIEDYRAGLTVDRRHDEEDRQARRRVQCPTLCLWSTKDDLEDLYGDVLAVWQPWTILLEGGPIESGHHMAEEAPHELANQLSHFFSAG